MIVVRMAGTRKCSSAWMRSGKRVTATSNIAICTESHERIKILTNRKSPASVMVKSHIKNWKVEIGLPGMENKTVIATSANGRAIMERLNVYSIPNCESKFAAIKNIQAETKENHAASGSKAFETM